MNSGPSIPFVRTLPHPWDTRSPALSRVRVKWKSVLLDPQPSLLTPRRRAFRLCSNDSSVLCRSVTPRRRACGPYGLSLHPPSCGSVATTGVSEVSRFSCMKFLDVPWGLRPRRTEQELALSLPSMLPSAHIYRVGVRVVCFRGSMSHPAYPLSTLHCVPHGSSARLEAKWIATPFL